MLEDFLREIGAFERKHTGRVLGEHLINTGMILHRSKCPPFVCLAGALHSVYGTRVYKNSCLTEEGRDTVRKLFGEDVERLSWLFSILDRPACLGVGGTRRWDNKEPVEVSESDLIALRLIEAANLIEQGGGLEKQPFLRTYWHEWRAANFFNTGVYDVKSDDQDAEAEDAESGRAPEHGTARAS